MNEQQKTDGWKNEDIYYYYILLFLYWYGYQNWERTFAYNNQDRYPVHPLSPYSVLWNASNHPVVDWVKNVNSSRNGSTLSLLLVFYSLRCMVEYTERSLGVLETSPTSPKSPKRLLHFVLVFAAVINFLLSINP